MAYTVKVGTLGTSEVTLTACQPDEPEWEVNRPGSFSFLVGVTEPQASLCIPLEREIAVYDGATRIWAGPIWTQDLVEGPAWKFGCEGLLSYFGERNIDSGADRTNYLLNPEFEDDLNHWTAVNTTATAVTTQRILGTKSAQLVQVSARQDAYLVQTIAVTGTGVGSLFTLVGHDKLSPTGWIGEALGDFGLVLARTVGGDIITSGTQGGEIYGDSPKGTWARPKVTVWVPPNEQEVLEARLYSPGGTVWWDALSLTLMESLSSVEDVDDFLKEQTEIAANIVSFLQDSAYGKSDLLITVDCPASGISRERHYQFAAHVNGLQALVEFTEMRDGFDISIGPDRVFRTHFRRKGTDRTATVTLKTFRDGGSGENCIIEGYTFSGKAAATGVVILGDGDGPDREEGGWVDAAHPNRPTLEKVETPRATTDIDTLDEMAEERGEVLSRPEVLVLRVTDSTLVSTLEEGDMVTVDVDYHSLQVTGEWRIMKRRLDMGGPTLQCTLNPWSGT